MPPCMYVSIINTISHVWVFVQKQQIFFSFFLQNTATALKSSQNQLWFFFLSYCFFDEPTWKLSHYFYTWKGCLCMNFYLYILFFVCANEMTMIFLRLGLQKNSSSYFLQLFSGSAICVTNFMQKKAREMNYLLHILL